MVTVVRAAAAVILRGGPVCPAVLGALTGYYGLGNLDRRDRIAAVLFLCLFSILVIAAARALDLLAGKGLFRQIGILACALGTGFSLGFAARNAAVVPVRLGLPPASVTGVSGILGDDPRAFYDGRGMGSLILRSASGPGGLRTSASGGVPVFFPAGAIPRLKE
ncbi:MAG: hypothetical protein LBP32_04660, partial [Spirochaetaceae bacterium]|nr:hypothetical protein [Spirochaetaceae bacterium]